MTRKLYLLSLLLLCVLAWPATGSAADSLEAQEQQIRQLLQNSIRLDEITTILGMNSSEAQQHLLKLTAQLKALESDYEKLKQAHQQLTDSYNRMIVLSQRQTDSLKKINESFEAYSREAKAKINSLERQKKLIEIVAGAALIYAATK